MNRKALIVGATGLTGKYCLDFLSKDKRYTSITVLSRRLITFEHPKVKNICIDFNQIDQYASEINADDLFYCLGTTMREAKHKENFKKIDFEYGKAIAQIAQKNGVRQFILISSMGANTQSIFFYNRIKGLLEEAVLKMGFPSVHIFRPSLLLGKRNQQRPGERIFQFLGKMLNPLIVGNARPYRAISAIRVAKAMVEAACKDMSGAHIHTRKSILNLSQ